MRIGFVGVGKIGHPMCRRFVDGGYDVVAFDLDADALRRITALGAEAAGSPAEVASRSDVAFCCLPTPAAVEQVVAGDDGLLAGAGARTIVDLSTNDPDVVRRLAERGRAVGVDFLDSPVAGGVPKAEDGTLTLIVGGDDEAFERVRPLLERLGSSIHLLGPPGAGSVGKIANNIMSMCNMLAANEAFLVVKRCGIDPERFFAMVDGASGGSAVLERFPRKVFKGDFSADFTIDMGVKDVGLALKLGEQTRVPMTFGTLAKLVFQQAQAAGYGDEDTCAAIRVLEDLVGDEVRASG